MTLIAKLWSNNTLTLTLRTLKSFDIIPALKRLQKAIRYHENVDRRVGEDWSIAREYVRSLLHKMT